MLTSQDNLSVNGELSKSNDSLSDNTKVSTKCFDHPVCFDYPSVRVKLNLAVTI